MPANHVMAIDAGTSRVRCIVIDLEGNVLSCCGREWNYHTPGETGSFGREFAPDLFWNIICDTIKETLHSAAVSPETIVGVSTTSQRQGTVFLDKDGRELYAGPNIDLRALTEGLLLDGQFGAELYAITGHTPSFLFAPAKLRWFQVNRPKIYAQIASVLTISDWITYRLSGERVSEVCGACEMGLVDLRHRQWSYRLRELLSLPVDIYPPLVPAGSRVGKITGRAAAETGIRAGTPVVQGAPDTHCGLVGMGIKDKGQAAAVLGWSAPVQLVTEEPVIDSEKRVWTGCHPLPERWVLESSAGEAGNAYYWLKEMMFGQKNFLGKEVYALMDGMALETPPRYSGSAGFYRSYRYEHEPSDHELWWVPFPGTSQCE